MYLHLGNGYIIKNEELLGIFDIRQKKANIYKLFVKPKLENKNVVNLAGRYAPASCVLTTDKIILSGISALTLRNRLGMGINEKED